MIVVELVGGPLDGRKITVADHIAHIGLDDMPGQTGLISEIYDVTGERRNGATIAVYRRPLPA